jgi:hypothetical protein
MDTSKLKTAGIVTVTMVLASNLTAGKGTLWQGGAMFAAAYVALTYIAPKI